MNDQELALKLLIVLSKSCASVAKVAETDIKRYGLNITEFAVLELLYHKGDIPIQKLASKMILASGSMTYVVDKLLSKGFITKETCEKDRRVTYACISPRGKEKIATVFPSHQLAIAELFTHLTASQKEALIDTLKIIGQTAQDIFQDKKDA
ncbi:MAG: MarR family transcriptional regulator [Defluviitaleaceae bacterium]|nr:MarR family transcriptional regulator [Defluviitaleaceae bacterium]